MFRLTIKNLAANRIRFALTTFAVVLAVSFVVSSFVLTDGLRSSFDDLSGEIVGSTDYEIRPAGDFGATDQLDESVLAEVSGVEGIAAAAPLVETQNTVRPITPSGEQISQNGPPQLAFGWVDEPRLSNVTVVEGAAPAAADEFTMDLDAAARHGFEVGQTYDVITPTGTRQVTLTGLTSFGEDNATLGATLMQFDLETLQDMRGYDGYDKISLAVEAGADRGAIEAELAAVTSGGSTVQVVDQATLTSETEAEFNSGVSLFGNVLLGFAGISLFVSVFLIYNTFSIVLGQRTKEMALLRTVGADPAQLRRSVIGEAIVIGVLASAIGIAGGIGVAFGLRGLFDALGASLPDSPTIVSLRTILVASAVGIGVTLVSAVGPANKASRVPPVAALRDGAAAGGASGGLRLVIGSALVAVGVAAVAAGLFVASGTASVITLLAVGAMAVFVGITMVSPLVAVPLTKIMGWPAERLVGVSGRLAHQNAGRNPQRTATTAAALMIGLAMVAMAFTVGESVKAQFRSTLDSAVKADYLVTTEGDDDALSAVVADDLVSTGVVADVVSFGYDEAIIPESSASQPTGANAAGGGGEPQPIDIMATDLAVLPNLVDIDIIDGVGHDSAVTDAVLLSNEEADATGIAVGDTVGATLSNGLARELTVIGVYGDDIAIEDDYLVDLSTLDGAGTGYEVYWMAFSVIDDAAQADVDAAVAAVGAAHPQGTIQTANQFVETLEGQIDQVLATVNVMVALAVVIALIGIANTLALSVFERTRELGLLRAVGMTRRQVRRMIRLEAGLVALFGATLGVSIGVLFGWAAVAALPETITSTLAIPVDRIAILVAVAGIAGLVAAWGPARRAGRLDVLDAISGG